VRIGTVGEWEASALNSDRTTKGEANGTAPAREKIEQPVEAESRLDTLLSALMRREAQQAEKSPPPQEASPFDVLRDQFREELIPVFEEMKEKYAASGVMLSMDVANFLDGGRQIEIEFVREPFIIRLEGTVTDRAIAFNEIKSTRTVDGAITGGPMLMTRRLTGEKFRGFLCERIATLIKSVLAANRVVSASSTR